MRRSVNINNTIVIHQCGNLAHYHSYHLRPIQLIKIACNLLNGPFLGLNKF